MKLFLSNDITAQLPPCAATIGFFDGLHRGHQFLIDKVRQVAGEHGLLSAVITFTNHPRTVTDASCTMKLLSTFDEKMRLLGQSGIDECFALDFDHQTADMTARQFMSEVLKRRFNVGMLVIGYDHRFGKGRKESFEDYCRYGDELGIKVVRAEGMAGGRHEVSSSYIRSALAEGNVRRAAMALGRDYSMTGTVVGGFHIGRQLGFPTANINLPGEKLLPRGGVYAATMDVDGKTYDGMLNIGSRPTFEQGTGQTVEMHLFDFTNNIYGKTVTINFVERIRDERKFDSPDQLANQLKDDERHIRTIFYIKRNADADPREIALHASKDTAIDYAAAATQIAGRQTARHKLPLFAATEGIIYPVHLSMEQCSSQATAEFKASLVGGESLIDLTGGFGVDCLLMSRRFDTATYVERNTTLCSIMQHNKSLLDGDNITVVNAEATEFLTSCKTVDMIYLDPARRDTHGGKTVLITQCEPDLTAINGTLLDKARKVMLKLSPMLDLTAATSTLEGVDKAFIVSVGGECKELLLILDRHASGGTEITAVNLAAQGNEVFTFTRHEEETASPAYANEVGTYLYEPNASVLKAGAFKSLATRFALAKLAPSTHLYTSKTPVAGFPGRCFKVTTVHEFNKQGLKTLSTTCPKANIATRNFPLSPEELKKKLRIADGGDDYIFATTLMDKRRVMVVGRKAPQNP